MRDLYLTADRLRANGACEEEVARFERTFGPKAKVAVCDINFRAAVAARLPIWWLAFKYLSWPTFLRLDACWMDSPSDPRYERNAGVYWKAIKAKMKRDNAPRPAEWY